MRASQTNISFECMDIAYPLTITYFDASGASTQVPFADDNALYAFLSNLDPSAALEINYPVTVVDATGASVTIHNNDELETAIETAALACNGDGDNNGDGDDDDDNDNDNDNDGKVTGH